MRLRKSTYLLAAAFAALLVVIGLSALAVWRNARTAQNRVTELHSAHLREGDALALIRADVYLTGILTRDCLLDPDPSHAAQYRDQFRQIRASTEQAFEVLRSPGSDDLQKSALERLHRELDLYWDPTETILSWTPDDKRLHGSTVLRQRVRRREEIFALASQVEKLITANFQQERARLTRADQDFRRSLGWISAIALVLSAGIISLTIARVSQLERHSLHAESELRRLSGQLRTAQEQERRYLSRELHDQVGQMLTALRMELASIARMHADAGSDFSARIARAKGTVEQTLRIVRNIAMLLRPSMLDDLGLTPALAWHIKEFSRSTSMEIRSEIDPAADTLPDPQRTCLYRVVQEALTNCARHSGAKHIDISVKVSGDEVLASIRDDGRGFAKSAVKTGGLGLLGMEERVRELRGSVRVISSPGQGAEIQIRIPRTSEPEVTDDSHPDRGRSRDRSDRVEASA